MGFEVRVKMPGLEKLQFTSKLDDEGGLKTKVSFEVDGKVKDLARLLNLAQQRRELYAVVGCEQAMFDLQLTEIRQDAEAEEGEGDEYEGEQYDDGGEGDSEAESEPGDAEGPTTELFYKVVQLASKQSWEGNAVSPEAACEQAGWPIAECTIRVKTEKGGWAKAKLTPPAPAKEVGAEAIAADNGMGDEADIGQPQDLPLSDELVAWMDANAVRDVLGFYAAPCPFHDDKGASLRVWPESDFYECPVCGAGGALDRLARRLGLIPQEAGTSA